MHQMIGLNSTFFLSLLHRYSIASWALSLLLLAGSRQLQGSLNNTPFQVAASPVNYVTWNASTAHLQQLAKLLNSATAVHQLCPNVSHIDFMPCASDGPLREVRVMAGRSVLDLTPYAIRGISLKDVVLPTNSSSYSRRQQLQPQPLTMSMPYRANIYKVSNAYVSFDGRVFTNQSVFCESGYTSRDRWFAKHFDRVQFVDEPVLLLNQIFRSNFYHGFIEAFTKLWLSIPILHRYPHIRIIVESSSHFERHKKLLPLLDGLNLPKWSALRFMPIVNLSSLVLAKEVIFPNHIPHFMPREVAIDFRTHLLNRFPNLWTNDRIDNNRTATATKRPGVLLYDRTNSVERRLDPMNSRSIFHGLRMRYGKVAAFIRVFYGNESLKKTMNLFAHTHIFIAAHGAGMSNLLFLPMPVANATVAIVEIFPPQGGRVHCYEEMATSLGFRHYTYRATTGHHRGTVNMAVNISEFLPRLFSVIDPLMLR